MMKTAHLGNGQRILDTVLCESQFEIHPIIYLAGQWWRPMVS